MPRDPTRLPGGARVAAILFLAYGSIVIAAALFWRTGDGWIFVAIRGLALVVIAAGLFAGARWAWLLGVVFPGIWALRGLFELGGALLAYRDGEAVVSGLAAGLLAISVAVLATGTGLLLTREVRRAYLDSGRPARS